jgi:Mg2+-importing ATPase
VVIRNGRSLQVDVTSLVPGDLVELRLGDIVPADIRLIEVAGFACDESALTGESLPTDKPWLRSPLRHRTSRETSSPVLPRRT